MCDNCDQKLALYRSILAPNLSMLENAGEVFNRRSFQQKFSRGSDPPKLLPEIEVF